MILKCEMCGGRLEPKEGTSNVWVCPYCGTVVLSECSRLSKLDMPFPETWTDIISLSGNDVCLAGLKADGTVVVLKAEAGVLEEVESWTNVEGSIYDGTQRHRFSEGWERACSR